MRKQLFRKPMVVLLTFFILLGSLTTASSAAEEGSHASIQSIDVKVFDGLADAEMITAETSYHVQVTVQNTGTDTISPIVTLYEIRDGQDDATVDSAQCTGELVEGSDALTLDYSWTPSADGTCSLKAIATVPDEVGTGTTTLDTNTLVSITVSKAKVVVISADMLDTNHIVLTMSSALTNTEGDPAAFTVSGVASSPTVSTVSVLGTEVMLSLSEEIVGTDTPAVSYTHTGTNDLTNGTLVTDFSDQAVTNALAGEPAILTIMDIESSGTTSPTLSDVTAGPVTVGDSISATSSEDGTLYLVPSATASDKTSIETAGSAANGTQVTATAGTAASLSTAGFEAGTYVVYAIDASGNVSAPSAAITVNAGRFSGGSGTESDPYQISTESDLRALGTELNGGHFDTAGVYFVQTKDIDVSSGGDWAPIGGTSASTGITCFQGNYDGQNHQITGLSQNGDYHERGGLFGYLDCNDGGTVSIKNIRLVEPEIINPTTSGSGCTGGITAGIFQTGKPLSLTIENCVIEDGTIQSALSNTGGIAGNLNVSVGKETTITISGCAVLDTDISGANYVGGIAGKNSSAKYAYMQNCRVDGGTVNASGASAGGIAGYFASGLRSGIGEMSGCFSTAHVTAAANTAGGLCGNAKNCSIKNCYATGDVAATFIAGGAVGSAGSSISMQNVCASGTVMVTAETSSYSIAAGGLFGSASASEDIKNNVAINTEIIHSEETDAVMGRVSGSATTTAYCDNYAYEYMIVDGAVPSDSNVGVSTSVQGGSVTSANLKTKSFWEGLGFDFTETTGDWIWNETDSDGYPTLNGFDGVTQTVAVPEDDTTSPALSDVTAGPLTVGDFLSATSSKNGRLYLVPSATTATQEVIAAAAAANGATARAWAEEPADISTAGLAAGGYVVYAIDGLCHVSSPSAEITVTAADTTLANITWYTDDTSAEEFTITMANQLYGLRMLVAGNITGYAATDFSGKTIKLGGNIDLSTVCSETSGSWVSIGTARTPFAGTFDGAGYTVSNLYIHSSTDNQSLFGYAEGTIKNVVVSGTVSGGSNVGAVVGTSTGTVKNCISLASVSGTSNVGGVVGNAADISACIYYKEDAAIGVAGSSDSAEGCYYLAESAHKGAIGEAKTAAEFATREMAYLMDTATGSHADEWQMGTNYPVLGNSSTVYYVSLTLEVAQANKSVSLTGTDTITVSTNGSTESAYLIKGESIALNVSSDDAAYEPVFYPGGAVAEDNGTYSIPVSSDDVVLTYRFAQSISADTSWYDADKSIFTLTTEAELRGLAALVNDDGVSFEDKIIYLGNDITVVGDFWPIIGNKTHKFCGAFDGNNHTVNGLYIKTISTDGNIYNYQGFFGYLDSESTVQNLKLDGIVADGKCYCGILAGYADAYCTINNCETNGTVSYTDNTLTKSMPPVCSALWMITAL